MVEGSLGAERYEGLIDWTLICELEDEGNNIVSAVEEKLKKGKLR